MEGVKDSNKKNILIGSPIQLKNISKEIKLKINHVSIFQTHYLFGFDFGKHLN